MSFLGSNGVEPLQRDLGGPVGGGWARLAPPLGSSRHRSLSRSENGVAFRALHRQPGGGRGKGWQPSSLRSK
jgi:hypothetical protein